MKKAINLKQFVIIILILFFSSCKGFKVNDASIEILQKTDSDTERFWEICIDYTNIRFMMDSPKAYFDIYTKDGVSKIYSMSLLNFENGCSTVNVLKELTNRNTSVENLRFLKDLKLVDVDSIELKIKRKSNHKKYVFKKTFEKVDLI
jgi:hypothetical protein